MSASLELVTAPAVEPVSLQEARDHLRAIEDTAGTEDAVIAGLIKRARELFDGRDGFLGRQLITATWDLTIDEFPIGDFIDLPLAPVQSITSITYIDTSGNEQTLDSGVYSLSKDLTNQPRVWLTYTGEWPDTRDIQEAVTIRFVAGYGLQADVPEPIRAAILLMIGHGYENREPVNIGNIVTTIPMTVDALIWPYRRIKP